MSDGENAKSGPVRGKVAGQTIRDDRFPFLFAIVVAVLGAVMGAYLLLRLV